MRKLRREAKHARTVPPDERLAQGSEDDQGIPADAGIRSIAHFLGLCIALACEADGANAEVFLNNADMAIERLAGMAGRRTARRKAAYRPGSGFLESRLRADAHRVERLAAGYTGIRNVTSWQRFRYRRASLADVSARMSAAIKLLRDQRGLQARRYTGARSAAYFKKLPGDWSPTSGAGAEAFGRIMRQTHCTFARHSTIWTAPPWPGATIEDAIPPWSRALLGFTEAIRREPLDGFLMALPAKFGDDLVGLSATTRQVLGGLAAMDGRSGCDIQAAGREGWHFTFSGERMFVITMAPCYPENHSRYNFGEPWVFVLLQPDRAFDRAVSPSGAGLISPAVRGRIRGEYRRHGRPYELSITLSPFEAFRYVKPLAIGDAPVRWWDATSVI